MFDPFFFGYGSLVNQQTHAYPEATVAHVRGWQRAWVGTRLRQVAFLTARPRAGAEIAGLIASVPGNDWAALDLREAAYARHRVEEISHKHPTASEVQIYSVEDAHVEPGDHPILLSYLDTVVQGFLVEFGEDGARAFFDTTEGWHLPIRDDRADPVYSRATVLSDGERAFVDENLARVKGD